jgi:hypothetical protein
MSEPISRIGHKPAKTYISQSKSLTNACIYYNTFFHKNQALLNRVKQMGERQCSTKN